jgi:hypothetical protein
MSNQKGFLLGHENKISTHLLNIEGHEEMVTVISIIISTVKPKRTTTYEKRPPVYNDHNFEVPF